MKTKKSNRCDILWYVINVNQPILGMDMIHCGRPLMKTKKRRGPKIGSIMEYTRYDRR